MTRLAWRRVTPVALICVLSLGTSSCLETTRFRVGYATFFVEFYDPVVDPFGVVQLAYCARNLTFTGNIDTTCPRLPMVYSFGMDAWVTCTYRDAAGFARAYTDLFYFWPGYIQESPCAGTFDAPPDEPVMDLTRDSTLSRNDEGQVLLADDVELAGEQPSLTQQRADSTEVTGETPPTGLSETEIATVPIRSGETTLGEPPEDANARPELDTTSEVERDARGRVVLDGNVELSDEPTDIDQLREDWERVVGEDAPDDRLDEQPGDPIRTSPTRLGRP